LIELQLWISSAEGAAGGDAPLEASCIAIPEPTVPAWLIELYICTLAPDRSGPWLADRPAIRPDCSESVTTVEAMLPAESEPVAVARRLETVCALLSLVEVGVEKFRYEVPEKPDIDEVMAIGPFDRQRAVNGTRRPIILPPRRRPCQTTAATGAQRCGGNSSMPLAGCVGKRARMSRRY
jgi:hypothetical protein